MEYLVTMTTHVPDGTPQQAVDDVRAREAVHTRDLATEGHLLRLWRPPLQPGGWRTLRRLPPTMPTSSSRSWLRCH